MAFLAGTTHGIAPNIYDQHVSKGWRDPRARGRHWRTLRAELLATNLATNGGRCTASIPKVCTGKATEVHHTLGIQVTGHDAKYLACVCRPCNLHIGDPATAADPPVMYRPVW